MPNVHGRISGALILQIVLFTEVMFSHPSSEKKCSGEFTDPFYVKVRYLLLLGQIVKTYAFP